MLRSLVDWVVIIAALVAAASWTWATILGVGMAAVFLQSMAMILAACMSLTRPGLTASEVCTAALGVLMVATPLLFGFADVQPAAWTAWIVGAVVAVMGVIGTALSRTYQRRPVAR